MTTAIINKWTFFKSERNPQFIDNLKTVKAETCLIANNSDKNLYIVTKLPRRYTTINKFQYVIRDEVFLKENTEEREQYVSDSILEMRKRARSRMLTLAAAYEPAREKKIVKALFVTLNLPQHNIPIHKWLDRYLKNHRRNGRNIYAYFWCLEFGKDGDHPHYHLCVYTDYKVRLSDWFPDKHGWISNDDLIKNGNTCKTEIVRKSVYRYMTKYFTKNHSYFCLNWRNYGFSRNYCSF